MYILIGFIDILKDMKTRILNVAEMTQHTTFYQFLTMCLKYDMDLHEAQRYTTQDAMPVFIKNNNVFVDRTNKLYRNWRLEFNSLVYLLDSNLAPIETTTLTP